MLSVQVDATKGIAILEPHGALSKEDFERAARTIDPHIDKSGRLNGIVVRSQQFPGWDSFGALASHLRFVKDHHQKIARVALCTDSALGSVAPKVGRHFVKAEIRAFKFAEFDLARAWAAGGAKG
ncbi:MAG TPA: STAS/SEC14 domain-containing protein [Burkholderiales bacterium]|nr:STAS/SEC14 domain-containing protein [Burkholderiales bacterium]